MDVSKYFAIRRLPTAALGPDGKWGTPITCPIPCNLIVIENGDSVNAQAVRTDPADPATEKNLPASLELTLRVHPSNDAVFQTGDTVCRVAPAAGAGPVIVSFFR